MTPILCRLNWHRWNRPRRIRGFRIRRCSACKIRQEETFPGPTWRTVAPKPRLHPQSEAEENQVDRRRGLEPL